MHGESVLFLQRIFEHMLGFVENSPTVFKNVT